MIKLFKKQDQENIQPQQETKEVEVKQSKEEIKPDNSIFNDEPFFSEEEQSLNTEIFEVPKNDVIQAQEIDLLEELSTKPLITTENKTITQEDNFDIDSLLEEGKKIEENALKQQSLKLGKNIINHSKSKIDENQPKENCENEETKFYVDSSGEQALAFLYGEKGVEITPNDKLKEKINEELVSSDKQSEENKMEKIAEEKQEVEMNKRAQIDLNKVDDLIKQIDEIDLNAQLKLYENLQQRKKALDTQYMQYNFQKEQLEKEIDKIEKEILEISGLDNIEDYASYILKTIQNNEEILKDFLTEIETKEKQIQQIKQDLSNLEN